MASEMLEQCFAEVFSVFRIDARQGHYIPPKSQVVLPVKFLPAMSADKGHVFCKYTFTFGGEQVTNSVQVSKQNNSLPFYVLIFNDSFCSKFSRLNFFQRIITLLSIQTDLNYKSNIIYITVFLLFLSEGWGL